MACNFYCLGDSVIYGTLADTGLYLALPAVFNNLNCPFDQEEAPTSKRYSQWRISAFTPLRNEAIQLEALGKFSLLMKQVSYQRHVSVDSFHLIQAYKTPPTGAESA